MRKRVKFLVFIMAVLLLTGLVMVPVSVNSASEPYYTGSLNDDEYTFGDTLKFSGTVYGDGGTIEKIYIHYYDPDNSNDSGVIAEEFPYTSSYRMSKLGSFTIGEDIMFNSTTYTVKVWGKNEGGTGVLLYEEDVTITELEEPGDFEITNPSEGDYVDADSSLTVKWSSSSNVEYYRVCLVNRTEGTEIIPSTKVGTNRSYKISASYLEPGMKYRIYVTAYNDVDSWGTYVDFKTKAGATPTPVPEPYVSNVNISASVKMGDTFSLSGYVKANGGTLDKVHINTYLKSNNNYNYVLFSEEGLNVTSFSLSKAGSYVVGKDIFEKEGTYLLFLYAKNKGGKSAELISMEIRVEKAEVTPTPVPEPYASNVNISASVKMGDTFSLSGYVKANGGTLDKVHINTYLKSNNNYNYVLFSEEGLNVTSFSLSKAGSYVVGKDIFEKEGTYLLFLYAKNEGGDSAELISMEIRVEKAEVTPTPVPEPYVWGMDIPTSLKMGDTFSMSGYIEGNGAMLDKVHINTYMPSNNYWQYVLFSESGLGNGWFEMSNVGTYEVGKDIFEQPGTYRLFIYAKNEGGESKELYSVDIKVAAAPTPTPVPAPYISNIDIETTVTIGDSFSLSGYVQGNGGTIDKVHINTYLESNNNYNYVLYSQEGLHKSSFNLNQAGSFVVGKDIFTKAGTYRLYIYAKNENGGSVELYSTKVKVVDAPVTVPPTPTEKVKVGEFDIVCPAEDATVSADAGLILMWTEAKNAKYYHYAVSDITTGLNNWVVPSTKIRETSVVIPAGTLKAGRNYVVCVTAYYDENTYLGEKVYITAQVAPITAPPTTPPVTSGPEYTFVELNQTMYVKEDVNVRSLPSTKGDRWGSLKANEKILVTGKCVETGWYRFVYNGKTAYVSGNYVTAGVTPPAEPPTITPITPEPPTSKPEFTFTDLEQSMSVKADVNVRSLPSTKGDKLGVLKKDDKIIVTGRCNETGWYRLVYKGQTAYVSGKYVVDDSSTITPITPSSVSSKQDNSYSEEYRAFAFSELVYYPGRNKQAEKLLAEYVGNKEKTVNQYLDALKEKGLLKKVIGDSGTFDTELYLRTMIGECSILDYQPNTKNGFTAMAFFNPETESITISYGGTEPNDWLKDWTQDAVFAMCESLPEQFPEALDYYEKIRATYKKTCKEIKLTGHSLGGALAMYVCAYTNESTITVNGANGIAWNNIILDAYQNINMRIAKYPEANVYHKVAGDWNCTNYLTEQIKFSVNGFFSTSLNYWFHDFGTKYTKGIVLPYQKTNEVGTHHIFAFMVYDAEQSRFTIPYSLDRTGKIQYAFPSETLENPYSLNDPFHQELSIATDGLFFIGTMGGHNQVDISDVDYVVVPKNNLHDSMLLIDKKEDGSDVRKISCIIHDPKVKLQFGDLETPAVVDIYITGIEIEQKDIVCTDAGSNYKVNIKKSFVDVELILPYGVSYRIYDRTGAIAVKQDNTYSEEYRAFAFSELVYYPGRNERAKEILQEFVGKKTKTVNQYLDALREEGILKTVIKDSGTFDTELYLRTMIGECIILDYISIAKSGFTAMTFLNPNTKSLTVSYGGSDDLKDYISDLEFAAMKTLSEQFPEALDYYELVCFIYTGKYKDINLTGHSLGGALAMYVCAYTNTPAITVNGANGIAWNNIVLDAYKNIDTRIVWYPDASVYQKTASNWNCTNYLTEVVSSSNLITKLNNEFHKFGTMFTNARSHYYQEENGLNGHHIFSFMTYNPAKKCYRIPEPRNLYPSEKLENPYSLNDPWHQKLTLSTDWLFFIDASVKQQEIDISSGDDYLVITEENPNKQITLKEGDNKSSVVILHKDKVKLHFEYLEKLRTLTIYIPGTELLEDDIFDGKGTNYELYIRNSEVDIEITLSNEVTCQIIDGSGKRYTYPKENGAWDEFWDKLFNRQ